MLDRKKEINSLDKATFKKILSEISVTLEFARLHNWGADNLNENDRNFLVQSFIQSGLESPIDNKDLDEICAAIGARAVTFK